jgi:hypothetical protein
MHRKYGQHLEFIQLDSTETPMTMGGITNISKTVLSGEDEEVWLELNFLKDHKHLAGASAKMEKDGSTDQLYKQFMELISPGSCIEGGFTRLRI